MKCTLKSVENKWLNCTNLGVMEGGGDGGGGVGVREQLKVVCTVHNQYVYPVHHGPPPPMIQP